MSWSAGVALRATGVAEIIDPQPYAVGAFAPTYRKQPNAIGTLPGVGFGEQQVHDLQATIAAMRVEAVASGTPIDLTQVLTVAKPLVRPRYSLRRRDPGHPSAALDRAFN